MAGKPRLPLVLTPAERRTLQGWASRRKTAQGLAQRARIVLLCADGRSNTAVAAELGSAATPWAGGATASPGSGLGA